MNSLVYLILFVYCSTLCFVSADVPTSVEEEESTCKRVAYSQAEECIKHGREAGSESPTKCLVEVVLNYVNCEKIFENESIEDLALEDATVRQHLGKINGDTIKCLIENAVDLTACVAGNLSKLNWMKVTTCVMKNMPKYPQCFRKKQL